MTIPRPDVTPEQLKLLADVGNAVVRYLDAGGEPTLAAFGRHLWVENPPPVVDVEPIAVIRLAALIRRVDGSHTLGAAALAEALLATDDVVVLP